MKRPKFAILGILTMVMLTACSTISSDAVDEWMALTSGSLESTSGPVALLAGQDMYAGDLDLDLNGSTLTVTFKTTDDWCLNETHLHVAAAAEDLPHSPGGLIPGQFDYSGYHTCANEVAYDIDLEALGFLGDVDFGQVAIAAHAVVEGVGSKAGYLETAWAEGASPFKNWSMYFEYSEPGCAAPEVHVIDEEGIASILAIEQILREDVVGTWPPESDTVAYLIRETDSIYTLQLDPTGADTQNIQSLVADISFCRKIEDLAPGTSPDGLETPEQGYEDTYDVSAEGYVLSVDFRANTAADRLGIELVLVD